MSDEKKALLEKIKILEEKLDIQRADLAAYGKQADEIREKIKNTGASMAATGTELRKLINDFESLGV